MTMIICIEKVVRGPLKSAASAALALGFILGTTSVSPADESTDRRLLRDLREIRHIIVIYQENWSFDSLYGQSPGADGLANGFDTLPQLDQAAVPAYSSLIYQTPSPLKGSPAVIDSQFPSVGGKLALASNHQLPLPLIPYERAPTTDYSAPPQLNPATTGPDAHLQDEQNFFADVASGELPPVTFVKPLGPNNEHPGYADVVTGQQHVASLVATLRKSKIWSDCVIVITYDENGGRWDHVVPPVRQDGWGVGVRVPTIVISPFARHGSIDSTEYETVSILKLIERRFNLAPLSARDADPKINDLTHTLCDQDCRHQHE